jgi:hypothetical protein
MGGVIYLAGGQMAQAVPVEFPKCLARVQAVRCFATTRQWHDWPGGPAPRTRRYGGGTVVAARRFSSAAWTGMRWSRR